MYLCVRNSHRTTARSENENKHTLALAPSIMFYTRRHFVACWWWWRGFCADAAPCVMLWAPARRFSRGDCRRRTRDAKRTLGDDVLLCVCVGLHVRLVYGHRVNVVRGGGKLFEIHTDEPCVGIVFSHRNDVVEVTGSQWPKSTACHISCGLWFGTCMKQYLSHSCT